jgi:hypothetical protein
MVSGGSRPFIFLVIRSCSEGEYNCRECFGSLLCHNNPYGFGNCMYKYTNQTNQLSRTTGLCSRNVQPGRWKERRGS